MLIAIIVASMPIQRKIICFSANWNGLSYIFSATYTLEEANMIMPMKSKQRKGKIIKMLSLLIIKHILDQ